MPLPSRELIFAVGSYALCSSCMLFFNKLSVSLTPEFGHNLLPGPISCMQLVFAVSFCGILHVSLLTYIYSRETSTLCFIFSSISAVAQTALFVVVHSFPRRLIWAKLLIVTLSCTIACTGPFLLEACTPLWSLFNIRTWRPKLCSEQPRP